LRDVYFNNIVDVDQEENWTKDFDPWGLTLVLCRCQW